MDNIKDTANLINEHFDAEILPVSSNALPDNLMNILKSALKKHIEYLLVSNFEKLLNAIYRIDIDEKKFNEALKLDSIESISSEVTELVIEREIQKAESRRKYRNQAPDDFK